MAIGRHLPPQCMPCALGRLIPLFNPNRSKRPTRCIGSGPLLLPLLHRWCHAATCGYCAVRPIPGPGRISTSGKPTASPHRSQLSWSSSCPAQCPLYGNARWSGRVGVVPIAPLHDHKQRRGKVASLVGEQVLMAFGAGLVGLPLQQALGAQPVQPSGEHVAGDPETCAELVKPA